MKKLKRIGPINPPTAILVVDLGCFVCTELLIIIKKAPIKIIINPIDKRLLVIKGFLEVITYKTYYEVNYKKS